MTRRRSRGDACVEDYDDVSTIKSYAVDPVVRMVDYTIVNGISDGLGGAQLAPSGTATREQAVIMANRFCSEFEKLSPNKSEVVITKPNTTVSTPNNLWNTPSTIIPDDKMTFVYGLGGSKYTSAEEAEAHMVEIAVPVWRLQSDGTKTTGTAYLQVNASLAAIYKAIFEEIYNGDEKFPINDVGCYSWAYRRAFAGHRGRYQPEREHGGDHQRRRLAHPRPAARTGRRTPTRSPFPRAATFTTPSPSTASPGAATPGTASATTCTSATSANKRISKRLLYAVFSFCRKKRLARRPGADNESIHDFCTFVLFRLLQKCQKINGHPDMVDNSIFLHNRLFVTSLNSNIVFRMVIISAREINICDSAI